MTHFAVIVLVSGSDADSEVDRLLAAHDDKSDWHQVGGRFTGLFDGHDPAKDSANSEPCRWCEASGTTTQAVADRFPAYQRNVGQPCLQCQGLGRELKWPTDWQAYRGDVIPAHTLDFDRLRFLPRAVVTPDGLWHDGRDRYNDPIWGQMVSALVDTHRAATAVAVDCHS